MPYNISTLPTRCYKALVHLIICLTSRMSRMSSSSMGSSMASTPNSRTRISPTNSASASSSSSTSQRCHRFSGKIHLYITNRINILDQNNNNPNRCCIVHQYLHRCHLGLLPDMADKWGIIL